MKRFFSSESVTSGHPDKVADQISDAILDEILSHDKEARVACEVALTTKTVLIMGEITASHKFDIEKLVRKTIKDIGYTDNSTGFSYDNVEVIVRLDMQSPDIAMGVNDSLEHHVSLDAADMLGAGDQGLIFGYACNETAELMPAAIMYAHALTKKLEIARKSGEIPYILPDGKAQVTMQYYEDEPVRIDTIVLSTQHKADVDIEFLRKEVRQKIIDAVLPAELIDNDTKVYINPTGRFVIGGPEGDSGLTGRKIIVDTYGGYARHGGGAFSGKDPTKVDRSAAYYARYVAKNIVKANLCDKCEIQIAYAIGKANPVSIDIQTFGTEKVDEENIKMAVKKVFDFRPMAIINALDLNNVCYLDTASNGHFGKRGFSWERVDKVEALLKAL
ncbi:MAG: methionine adenosyltransferase [Christensenellales bacterium]|jgi:S-adenosylmethionine synthetase